MPEGHLARLIWEVVERLDTSDIEEKYSEPGQHTYHHETMVAMLIYGYAIGIRSGRKIASACQTDTAFMLMGRWGRNRDFERFYQAISTLGLAYFTISYLQLRFLF